MSYNCRPKRHCGIGVQVANLYWKKTKMLVGMTGASLAERLSAPAQSLEGMVALPGTGQVVVCC